jgi:hypothetical protein
MTPCVQVVNKARVNEVADESALLAQYRKEISQLKAALLEGRGGMIITGDGEVVSAEEMLARMKSQHDERQRIMEEQLKTCVEQSYTVIDVQSAGADIVVVLAGKLIRLRKQAWLSQILYSCAS